MSDTSQENKGILGEIRGWENINLSRVIIQISICACLFLYIKNSQNFYIVILSVCDTLVEGLQYRYLYILWLLNSSYNMITKNKKLCHQSDVWSSIKQWTSHHRVNICVFFLISTCIPAATVTFEHIPMRSSFNICSNFKEIPSRFLRDIKFTIMGRSLVWVDKRKTTSDRSSHSQR